jgi:hypothetical protein
MRALASTAQRLREVREAYRNFLTLAVLEHMTADPSVMARVEQDVTQQQRHQRQREADDAKLADPHNHDWSLLYRGSVLDD